MQFSTNWQGSEKKKSIRDTADQITVSREPACFAVPLLVLRLVFMPTLGALATGSSFRASEAQDVGMFAFARKVVAFIPLPSLILPVGQSVNPSLFRDRQYGRRVGIACRCRSL